MHNDRSEADFKSALDNCASEPVHIPGTVQRFGCLIGVDPQNSRIAYASENCFDVIGKPCSELLGAESSEVLGRDILHSLNNVAARSGFAARSTLVGRFQLGGRDVDMHAFASDGIHVLQFEAAKDHVFNDGDALNTLAFVMNEIQACPDRATLLPLTTEILRHVSGHHRVMIYKFDRDFGGEIVAESRQRNMEPFLGLHFPQWDIPPQARAIMAKLPLRIIQDVDQAPVPLCAADASLPPLDTTLAECRGVSEIHMEYLRNMDIKSSMTLSINVEGALWGMIAFHHRAPRVAPPNLRELLLATRQVFSTKLVALSKQEQLDLVRKTDGIKDAVLDEIESEDAIEGAFARIGAVIQDVLQADGVTLQIGPKTIRYGQVPDQVVQDQLISEVQAQSGTPIVCDNLGARYPQFKAHLNGCAGVLATTGPTNRSLCIFRSEAAQKISWAGNPDKRVEVIAGQARLTPRANFSRYLQKTEGTCIAWTDSDIYFVDRIWVLINNAEFHALKNTLNRQQALMINELNHRVRNILALVRSVSRQARRHNGSLNSYSASLESRINALAAAHDIASDAAVTAVSIDQLIRIELTPYQKDQRIRVEGIDRYLHAEIAPIFSLVIHELATNAVKYGSLSDDNGTVTVTVSDAPGGVCIAWLETGGPIVSPPTDRGFGLALIEQAVPHEMGGRSELRFHPTGVEADLFLPIHNLDLEFTPSRSVRPQKPGTKEGTVSIPFEPEKIDGFALVVEDNFVIAKDMKDQLEQAGIKEVVVSSSVADALDVLSAERPAFAILDINLGSGKTSEQIAVQLRQNGVPFVFATGYGDRIDFAPEFSEVLRLTKPVTIADLQDAIMQTLSQQES